MALRGQVDSGQVILLKPAVTGILESSLYVDDLDRAVEFYQRVFGDAGDVGNLLKWVVVSSRRQRRRHSREEDTL